MINFPVSVLAERPSPNMSSRYVHVNSHDIVDVLRGEGFEPVKATTSSPTKRDQLFAKHRIDFQHADATQINGAIPRIIFINSHDGTSSAQLQAGMYRYVCSNGLVVGDTIAKSSIKHVGNDVRTIAQQAIDMARQTSKIRTTVERWAQIDLSAAQRNMYARLVAELRWGDGHMYDADTVLETRRAEDDQGDLWSVFNRAQENTVRGGLVGVSRSGRQLTSRPITDITRDVRYNGALWQLTEQFADVI